MATKKKPLAKLLEEVDTNFFQVGVKKVGCMIWLRTLLKNILERNRGK